MPRQVELALKASARKKGLKPGTDAYDRYVYGGLENWKKKHNWKEGKKDGK